MQYNDHWGRLLGQRSTGLSTCALHVSRGSRSTNWKCHWERRKGLWKSWTPPSFVHSKIKGNLWISYGYLMDMLLIFYGYVMGVLWISLMFFLVEEVLIHPIYIYIHGFIVERLISVALVSWRLPPSKFSSSEIRKVWLKIPMLRLDTSRVLVAYLDSSP